MRHRNPSHRDKPATSRTQGALTVLAIVIVGVIAAVLFMQPDESPVVGRRKAETATNTSRLSETNPPPSTPTPAAVAGNPKLNPLLGRWLRPDGNYVMVIDRIDPNGEMRAGYFNPSPIKVSRAEAFEKDGKASLYLELRDEGYPGSYYSLEYNPTNDGLAGKYFQAAMRETYEVVFFRMR